MSDDVRKVLVSEPELTVTFVVEQGVARVEFESSELDLTATDDVVAVLNGKGFEVVPTSSQNASAVFGEWSAFAGGSTQLMVRVYEFFEGWELGDT